MFVDTNILVNARIREAPHHEIAREGLERGLRGPEPLRISRQVMRKYLAVVTRPQVWPVPITRDEALDDLGRLGRAFEVLEDGPRVTDALLALCRDVRVGGRQVHDANIVATMLARGERRKSAVLNVGSRRYGGRLELVTG